MREPKLNQREFCAIRTALAVMYATPHSWDCYYYSHDQEPCSCGKLYAERGIMQFLEHHT